MTSVSFFTPYVDKENTSALGARPKTFANTNHKGGKLFTPLSNTANRKALKDVNQDLGKSDIPVKPQGLKLQGSAPVNKLFHDSVLKKPLHDPSRKQKTFATPAPVLREKTIVRKPDPLPDIEQMHVYHDSADIKPGNDHDLAGVVERLIRWRPPCLFGTRPDESSDEEEDNEELDDDLYDLVDLGLLMTIPTEVSVDDIILENVSEPDIDMPLIFLDDTFDIEDNLGSLEIHGGSTPQKSAYSSPYVNLSTL